MIKNHSTATLFLSKNDKNIPPFSSEGFFRWEDTVIFTY